MCDSAHFLLSDNQNIVSTSLVPITSCIFTFMHLLSLSWAYQAFASPIYERAAACPAGEYQYHQKKVSPLIRSIRKMLRIRETAPETFRQTRGHRTCDHSGSGWKWGSHLRSKLRRADLRWQWQRGFDRTVYTKLLSVQGRA